MARFFHYYVTWSRGVPPLPKHLRVINSRLLAADWDAPRLTEQGFEENVRNNDHRWRNPLVSPQMVAQIILDVSGIEAKVQAERCTSYIDDCECKWCDKDADAQRSHQTPHRHTRTHDRRSE